MHKNKMQTNRKCKGTVNKVHGAQKGATKKKSRVQKQDNENRHVHIKENKGKQQTQTYSHQPVLCSPLFSVVALH